MKVQIYCISGGGGRSRVTCLRKWSVEPASYMEIWDRYPAVIFTSRVSKSALFSIKSFPIDTKTHKIEQSSAFYGIKVVFNNRQPSLTLIQAGPWTNSRVVTMTTGLVHVYGLWDAEYEMADTQTGIRGNRPDQGAMVVLSPHLLVEVVTVCMTPSPA